MAPDLFELLGIVARGRGFEMIVWALTAIAGALLLYREQVAERGFRDGGAFGWLLGGGLLLLGLHRWVQVAFLEKLYFGFSGLVLPTYGVLMGLGFGLGVWVAYRLARRQADALQPMHVIELSFWVIIASLLGARLLFMITRIPHYVDLCLSPEAGETADCLAMLRFWEGGLVFYGGVLGALVGGWIWCRRSGVPYLVAADVAVCSLALGHAIGRVGCYAASCCFGARTDGPLAVFFPAYTSVWNQQLATADAASRHLLMEQMHTFGVHAIQLYEAAGELILFALLVGWVMPRRRWAGQVFVTWVGLYALLRFCLELVRGDAIRGYLFSWPVPPLARLLGMDPATPMLLTTSQAVALAFMVAAVVTGTFAARRARKEREALRREWLEAPSAGNA